MKKFELPRGELRISVTSGCNMKCIYCHNEGNHTIEKLSIENIDKLINSFLKYNLTSIRLTGGEPLIYPEIEELCKIIKSKYNLKLGINTNLVFSSKLFSLVDQGLIDRVVVGLDYFDNDISKNSPVGISSKEVKANIIKLKNKGVDVTVSTVYNGDFENIENLFNFCYSNNIRIKILEQVTFDKRDDLHNEYLQMRDKLTEKYGLNLSTEEKYYNQLQGYKDGNRVVSFLHSLHRNHECHFCKTLPLRVGANGGLHYCLFKEIKPLKFDKVEEEVVKFIEEMEG